MKNGAERPSEALAGGGARLNLLAPFRWRL